jgi:hypothetical protein
MCQAQPQMDLKYMTLPLLAASIAIRRNIICQKAVARYPVY